MRYAAALVRKTPSERTIIFLVASVQFINILDFMMVMPLGPDFAAALDIPTSHLGYIAGSYTAAAFVSGVAGAFFLDRFDRRSALAFAMLGLVLGTAAGGLATGLTSLMGARVLAGLFGGPATSLSISIIADVIPPERRGKAMGAVMGAFSAASVLGVPAGLELAQRGGWTLPFFAVAALGLVIAGLSTFLLPPLRGHLDGREGQGGLRQAWSEIGAIVRRRVVLLSYTMTAVMMMSGFVIIPNISAFVQYNLEYPREELGLLYLIGGAISFGSMRAAGSLVDRFGSFRTATAGTVVLLGILYTGFFSYVPGLPVLVIFIAFMVASTFRNVSHNTLTSRVPLASERARFTSIQSAVQHLAAAVAAFLSSRMLRELPDKKLDGMRSVTALSMLLAALVPMLLWAVESRLSPQLVRQQDGS
jgi:predicted MFS family arabinose efflux permease